MSLKTLAEAIILQSAEDFMDDKRNDEDIAFFGGEGFRVCAKIAEMDHPAQCTFLNLLRRRVTVRRPVGSRRVASVRNRVALHA